MGLLFFYYCIIYSRLNQVCLCVWAFRRSLPSLQRGNGVRIISLFLFAGLIYDAFFPFFRASSGLLHNVGNLISFNNIYSNRLLPSVQSVAELVASKKHRPNRHWQISLINTVCSRTDKIMILNQIQGVVPQNYGRINQKYGAFGSYSVPNAPNFNKI